MTRSNDSGSHPITILPPTLFPPSLHLATTAPPTAEYPAEMPELRIPRSATPSPDLMRLAYDIADLEAADYRATMATMPPESDESPVCGVVTR